MALEQHVLVVLSILVGFSLTRLLSFAVELIPSQRNHLYWVHLIWVLFMFLYVIAFWWWEFLLASVRQWSFPLYVFVIIYGILVYFLCALLSPGSLKSCESFKQYFFSRQKWFFGTMFLMFAVDLYDSSMKGKEHFHTLGLIYEVRIGFYLVCSLIAIKAKNERFHAAFAVLAVLGEIFFYLRTFFTFPTLPSPA